MKVCGSSALMRHSMAWPSNVMSSWRHVERPARTATRICSLHQIDAGDHLGDRMLHLQAGVHFDEVELAVFIEEFDVPAPR
jgi:ABC-type phosphate/phosphonate transport system ATPase subunit